MYKIIALLLVVGLLSCSKKIVTTTSSSEILDSTFMTETTQYDTIFVAGDTVILKEWVECDSVTNKPKPFKAKAKSGRASITLEVTDRGTLKVEGVCDSLQRLVETKDREIFRLRKETSNKSTTITKQPSKLKVWFDISCQLLAGLFVLLLLARVTGLKWPLGHRPNGG